MIAAHREAFNGSFSESRYAAFLKLLEERAGCPVPFRVSETPCFFPEALLDDLSRQGGELIQQLVDNPAYRETCDRELAPFLTCPNETPYPLFVQVDFGLIRNADGQPEARLVEIQGFPSLYCFQPLLAQTYIDAYQIGLGYRFLLGNHGLHDYFRCLRPIVSGHDPEQVVLLEIDPWNQKTLPDFIATRRILNIPIVDIMEVEREGRALYYRRDGKRIPIRRIYNRVIMDELERRRLTPPFSFSDDLDVEWAGHPNWFYRISKFSLPYLHHPSVPRTWFLDQVTDLPLSPERLVLKPLFSFAGLGVIVGPTASEIAAIPAVQRSQYILQERMAFHPWIATPDGATQAEIRVMYVWHDRPHPLATIIRMGRGKMMGVDHNKDLRWVGASASLAPIGQ